MQDKQLSSNGNKIKSVTDQETLKLAFYLTVKERRAKAHAYYLERSFLEERGCVWERMRAVLVIAILMLFWAMFFSMLEEMYF